MYFQASLQQYFTTLDNLWTGFVALMSSYQGSSDPLAQALYAAWTAA